MSNNSTLLPHDIEYKGNRTNEIVFYITNTKKQINSGLTRGELYSFIKNNNLGSRVNSKFGKNYTNLSTADLQNFYDEYTNIPEVCNSPNGAIPTIPAPTTSPNKSCSCTRENTVTNTVRLVDILRAIVSHRDDEFILSMIDAYDKTTSNYSNEEIAGMFKFVK